MDGIVMTHAETYLAETAEIAGKIDPLTIETMVNHLVELRERKGRLFILGLGGSAANASHAANDMRKLCGIEAYCLSDNVAELTARANDEGWQTIFSGILITSNACEKDALLVLSVGGGTTGVSIPLTMALREASNRKMTILGIVGRDGGNTKMMGDCVIVVPIVKPERVTPHTEGFQSVLLHCLVSHPKLQVNKTKW